MLFSIVDEGGFHGGEAGEGAVATEDRESEVERGTKGGEGDGEANEGEELGGLFSSSLEEGVQSSLERVGLPIGEGAEGGESRVEEGGELGFAEFFEEFVYFV